MRILYLSDLTPFNNTFIRQDVKLISDVHQVLYIAFEISHKKFGDIIINLFSKPLEYTKIVNKGYENALNYDIIVYVNKLLEIYKN